MDMSQQRVNADKDRWREFLNWCRVLLPLLGERVGVRAGQISPRMNANKHESWTKPAGSRRNSAAAFTMVEIALCLGVIAIALVAIIGVLPTGVRVQKDNREDTILNQEGMLWLEAIRSGSRGLDYLTNYVDMITLRSSKPNATVVFLSPGFQYTPPPGATPGPMLTNGQQIVGLLTTPKYIPDPDAN